ncbi:hypothetical protein EYF80_010890 [Liparis tanakae]|uniref:Uncharacterized protein n=1 Tax=Liparis tanakae TaxID=230148 RepID=A0A4Z2INA5_9TELE|nr:hypothetical protein EYF80_010890 [Liparis tanakae]
MTAEEAEWAPRKKLAMAAGLEVGCDVFAFERSCFNKGQTLAADFPKSLIILPDSDHVTRQPIRILRTPQEEGGCPHLDLKCSSERNGKEKNKLYGTSTSEEQLLARDEQRIHWRIQE